MVNAPHYYREETVKEGLNLSRIFLKGTSKNSFCGHLQRQLRSRILMYIKYTAVLRAKLPRICHPKRVFRGTPNSTSILTEAIRSSPQAVIDRYTNTYGGNGGYGNARKLRVI